MNTELLSKEEINVLIVSMLSGKSTPVENKLLLNWVKQSAENKTHFVRFRDAWQASSQFNSSDKSKTEKALEKINRSLDIHKNTPVKTISPFIRYFKVAALWILLFSLGIIASRLIFNTSGYKGQVSDISVMAPMGSKAITFLPDGSKVWLNAGSKIVYSTGENRKVREVKLSGEAYFDVTKDQNKPFIVEAEGLIVMVHGTQFNVKAYPEERSVETTLVEGSVSVNSKDNPSDIVILKPNEQVLFFKATGDRGESLVVTRGIDPQRFTLWINDRLQITGETLGSLAVMLERKYDVKIHFEIPALKELRFTGYIENETIEQVLEMIKISSSVDYKMKEREIWLKNK